MMRYVKHVWTRDKRGNAVSGATIIVYLAGTTSVATVYPAKTGGSAIAGASMTTDTSGKVTFYVDDSDYVAGRQFDLVISKTGYNTETLSDIHVF